MTYENLIGWMERLPGGLAIATILASAGMGAMSGSSTASAATMATIAVPQMRKHGYSERVATGVVTVSGTLAIMIPPSIAFVLYGIITETSIGKLLIAGIIHSRYPNDGYVLYRNSLVE
jgi:TRAP-type C4-dicarboxylate transport system permease large subunit